MRAKWERFRQALVQRIRYRITRAGLLFTVAVLMVGIGAAVSANNLLYLILATMLSIMLISGFISRLCLAGLELDFLVPDHVSAGRTLTASLFVRNLKAWMPSFSIQVIAVEEHYPPPLVRAVYFAVIPGGATLEELVEVRFAHRGAYRQNSFAFNTRFPFGFLEKTARVTLRREVVVYPSIDPQPGFEQFLAEINGEIETHYRGLGRDFYRIRPYEALESARHVDWKASAHTGALQVREFAREQEQNIEIFLDRDVPPGTEEWFERAVGCCAFLTWRLAEKAAAVRFRSQGFYLRLPEDGDIYTILRFLALVQALNGKPAEPPSDESSYRIVFTASPHRFEEAGWGDARLVGPSNLSGAGATEPPGEA